MYSRVRRMLIAGSAVACAGLLPFAASAPAHNDPGPFSDLPEIALPDTPALPGPDTTYAIKATMTGEQITPPSGPADPDGIGSFRATVNPATGQVCFTMMIDKIQETPMAAHIHRAPRGSENPTIFVDLFEHSHPDKFVSGCRTTAPLIASDIVANPDQYYVAVHNFEWIDGALRGQLSLAN